MWVSWFLTLSPPSFRFFYYSHDTSDFSVIWVNMVFYVVLPGYLATPPKCPRTKCLFEHMSVLWARQKPKKRSLGLIFSWCDTFNHLVASLFWVCRFVGTKRRKVTWADVELWRDIHCCTFDCRYGFKVRWTLFTFLLLICGVRLGGRPQVEHSNR